MGVKKIVLGVDIGNTNAVLALFEPIATGKIPHFLGNFRISTHAYNTSDELGHFLRSYLKELDTKPEDIASCIYSSVVPSFNILLEETMRDYFGCPCLAIHNGNAGLEYDYPQPGEIGADRLVNAAAGISLYGEDLIIVDLGTATTFCVIQNGRYQGGVIAPGIGLSMETLIKNTAKLRAFEFRRPESGVIGKTTTMALQSGFFYGWIGMLEKICNRIREFHPDRSYQTIATGGYASIFAREIPDLFQIVDADLTMKGLAILYDRNRI